MIDEEKTFREKGYYSTDLSFGSNKPVYAVCESENCDVEGGRGRWVRFSQYSTFCKKCTIINFHIHKHETDTEKLPWVDDDITYAEKGYRSVWLKPNSAKPVWCICANPDCEREGGRGRWVRFFQCRELCHLCAMRTDESRMKLGDRSRGRVVSDDTREKMIGENNPNWNGGISYGKYCEKFNNILKERIREKFGRECFLCEKDEKKNGRKLSVHHVDYDKDCMCGEKVCEMVPLCLRCHAITNYNRELWRRMILNQLALEGWI